MAAVVSGVAIYILLPALVKVFAAWPRFSSLEPVWLVAAVIAEGASFACSIALQRLVLRRKEWFPVATASLAGNALTNTLPAGDAAGAGLQFRMLAAAGIDVDSAAGGLAVSSLLGVGGLLALPIFSLPAILGGSQVRPGLVHAALLGLGGFVLFVVGSVTVLLTDKPLAVAARLIQRLWNATFGHRARVSGIDRRVLRERDSLRSTLGRDGWKAVLFVTGRLGFDYLCLLGGLRAAGSAPRPGLVLLAYAATGIVALVPITPGGLGIVEASLTGMLVLAGVSGGRAVLATLAYRLASYWLPLLAGAISYLLFRRRYGRGPLKGPAGRGRFDAGPGGVAVDPRVPRP
ncbi:MAG: lysylphosphatidylglycerol synthase transmembrane domain-containing protein [Acidimicrobiales bacterium]